MSINIHILEDPKLLGLNAAKLAAKSLNDAISKNGKARLLLSTGSSQFETLAQLVNESIDWTKVELFHLDEYVGLSVSHPASFRKYLKERFVDKLNLQSVHYIDGEEDINAVIKYLTEEIKKKPIDVALIGIGENGHIAFNDPPADFDTNASFIKVKLDLRCKTQQVNEGWFNSISDVPDFAITMTVNQILDSKIIISSVPHVSKSEAIFNCITKEVQSNFPSTILKTHSNWNLFIDNNSAKLLLNI